MEFHEKLQELRKKKGMTQEELAEQLFVSRTAISKWESGRGYPNIDSLKDISRFFGITIDDLLSGEALLAIAEKERKEKETQIRVIVFGLLDCSAAMLLFVPFFAQRVGGEAIAVSLLSASGISPILRWVYLLTVMGLAVWGALTLALQTFCPTRWPRVKQRGSLLLNAVGQVVFVAGLQPYAAVYLFVMLAIKVWILLQSR